MIVSSLSSFYHLPCAALRIDNNMHLLKIYPTLFFFTFSYLNIELCFYFRCSTYKCFPGKRYTVRVVQWMDCMYLTGNLCNFRRQSQSMFLTGSSLGGNKGRIINSFIRSFARLCIYYWAACAYSVFVGRLNQKLKIVKN